MQGGTSLRVRMDTKELPQGQLCLEHLLSVLHFGYKESKENNPSWKSRPWLEKHSWQRERLFERCCRDTKGHTRTFHNFSSQGHKTHFSPALVTVNKEADNGTHQLSPEGLPGLMLLNFISFQISEGCQGQRLPLLKGNLRASSLPLPSRWRYTCPCEMLRKRFLLCNPEKRFPSSLTAPTFSPCSDGS